MFIWDVFRSCLVGLRCLYDFIVSIHIIHYVYIFAGYFSVWFMNIINQVSNNFMLHASYSHWWSSSTPQWWKKIKNFLYARMQNDTPLHNAAQCCICAFMLSECFDPVPDAVSCWSLFLEKHTLRIFKWTHNTVYDDDDDNVLRIVVIDDRLYNLFIITFKAWLLDYISFLHKINYIIKLC